MEHRLGRLTGLLLLALTVGGGCATGASGPPSQAPAADLTALQTFVHEDLQAALDDALAHGDLTAADCWGALDSVVSAAAAAPARPALHGAASAFQALRDLANQATSGPSPMMVTINRGCAALFVDAQATLGRLGLLVGGTLAK